jgi:PBP1b-binding outer membrane lipoprotein LpoB
MKKGGKDLKKILSIFLAAMVIFLVSCSGEKTNKENKEKEKNKTQQVNVDKGLLSVTITLPASMFEDQNVDQAIEDAKKEGITATKNSDGSVTYKMSKKKHKEMMQEMKTSVIKTIDDTKSGKDFPSIKDVTYNNDFSEFTLVVDKEHMKIAWTDLLPSALVCQV